MEFLPHNCSVDPWAEQILELTNTAGASGGKKSGSKRPRILLLTEARKGDRGWRLHDYVDPKALRVDVKIEDEPG